MEIRIGVQHSPREISLETSLERDELLNRVNAALTDGSLLSIDDTKKDRTVLVPAAQISYVEVSNEEPRRVGFLG